MKTNEIVDLYQYERELYNQGIEYIAGVDEVGRGPLVGPVVVCCCVLPKDFRLEGLNDSKKLSEKKRNLYYDIIIKEALHIEIVEMSAQKIDELNIYQATKEAMKQSILITQNKINIQHVLIDAMPLEMDIPTTSIIKGDAKSISIAAASVVAKVHRDRLMQELHEQYPMYRFDKHKGYPTKEHVSLLKQYGVIEEYRRSFQPVKDCLEEQLELNL